MIERQELHCHVCNRYVQFNIDLSLNGNHVLPCPRCGHEHCRVVKNGVITGDRWDQRNGSAIYITSAYTTISMYSTATTSGSSSYVLSNSWASTTGTAGY